MELPSRQCSARWRCRQPLVASSATTRVLRLTTRRLAVTFTIALLALAAALVSPLPAAAQEARATITGTVRDGSGGIIPGATVTITHKEMGTTVTVVTNDVGFYQAPYLIPGAYQVAAELQGFKKTAREV